MRFDLLGSSTAAALLSGLLLLAPDLSAAFYVPGVAPTSYSKGDKVPLNVNHVTPASNEGDRSSRSKKIYGFDYYHDGFQFCKPEGGPTRQQESLGSIIFGDRILNSPYELNMAVNESCKYLCQKKFSQRSSKFTNNRILGAFNLNWLVDGLPAGSMAEDMMSKTVYYSVGFPLGEVVQGSPRLFNHHDIVIDYHELAGSKPPQYRVVGVIVLPSSRSDTKVDDEDVAHCGDENSPALEIDEEGGTSVTWTYAVYWRPSETPWATRWDKYLHVFDPKIHWFSLINSTFIVIFLSGTVATILLRALRKDIARYNRLEQFDLTDFSGTSAAVEDGVQEDSGWKLVHGDVFRSPRNPLLLSIFLGSGSQLFFMTGFTIVFAMMGFLSPSYRGFLATVMILLYSFFGFIGGYVSARMYKAFGGESWKKNIIFTPILVPGLVFGTFFLLNFLLWFQQSSGAVPFTTMLVILAIWFVISVPLSVAGSWIGFKQVAISQPVRTNQIPRQIPLPSTTLLRPIPSMLFGGMLPFLAIFVELYLIMNSIWFSKVYYMFGFLFICYGLMIITASTITIIMIYWLLCSENYHWQWRAFFDAGATAFYVFGNALFYWTGKLSLGGFTSNVLYLGYSLLISFLFFLLTGSIGFFASYAFVHRIYRSIKID